MDTSPEKIADNYPRIPRVTVHDPGGPSIAGVRSYTELKTVLLPFADEMM